MRYLTLELRAAPGRSATSHFNPKSGLRRIVSINDLEFAYAPVRDQVRDLREYL